MPSLRDFLLIIWFDIVVLKIFIVFLFHIPKCELLDTTSSAGDWSGYFAVKTPSDIALVAITQYNNYPQGPGYVLQTDTEPFEHVNTEDEIEEAVNEWAASQYS